MVRRWRFVYPNHDWGLVFAVSDGFVAIHLPNRFQDRSVMWRATLEDAQDAVDALAGYPGRTRMWLVESVLPPSDPMSEPATAWADILYSGLSGA
jgi:hypothetical protein